MHPTPSRTACKPSESVARPDDTAERWSTLGQVGLTSRGGQRKRDGVVEGQRTALGATAVELRSSDFADPRFARLTVAPPTAERGNGVLVLDRRPEAAGALELTTRGRDGCKQADPEHAPGAVAQLLRQRERFTRARLRL